MRTALCVHWVNSTIDAPPSPTDRPAAEPDQSSRRFRRRRDGVARRRSAGWGSARRSPTAPRTTTAPKRAADVYLAGRRGGRLYGYCATDDPHARRRHYQYRDCSAYIVVDDDFSAGAVRVSSGRLGRLRATAAHEFFHAVQFAYDAERGRLADGGHGAVWMEDRVADDVDENRRGSLEPAGASAGSRSTAARG